MASFESQADPVRLPPLGQQAKAFTEVDSGPQPPCGNDDNLTYPSLDQHPIVKSWSRRAAGDDWKPPGCTGWTELGFSTLITIAARFPYGANSENLLLHVGAISELTGMRYWSTTHKAWRTLIETAYALTDLRHGQKRGDFTANEMKEGAILYFEQVDNLTGKATYRMHIVEASANRLVINVENVSTVRYTLIPIFPPGELQSIYFLDHESDKVWRYYSIVRTGRKANGLIAGNESSSINRAVAFYRYIVGISTTQEPPEAR